MIEPTTTPVSTPGKKLVRDITASLVVFLVALPLCLGIALASNAPLLSGLITGIVAGILVGALSGSHTSVSGPAAGLTAVVAAQIASLGSYPAFLLAVVLAGIIQIGLGLLRAGRLSAFVPSSVIKGLLAAIGVILILKQIPHLVGHDLDPTGEFSFQQPDKENTFSEILRLFRGEVHYGAIVVGFVSIAILIIWERTPRLKRLLIPAPLIVVILGVLINLFFMRLGQPWAITNAEKHLVSVPIANNLNEIVGFLTFPDWSQWSNGKIYVAAITIALVASLETLLNLEAVDRIDPRQRQSPPDRELLAQGVGNMVTGAIGGLPMTSVIIRSSVNINSGAETKLSAILHGFLLAGTLVALPQYLNMIPLSALAAILIVTGFKLASPKLFKQMAAEGRYQLVPFLVTLIAIVFTDLLLGVLIGLAVAAAFILNSNLRRPMRKTVESHVSGPVTVIKLPDQISFLNRASLEEALRSQPRGSRMILDASHTDYIDPDVLSLIKDFKEVTSPQQGIEVLTRGFKPRYGFEHQPLVVHHSTAESRAKLTPADVIQILIEGNRRFASGEILTRDPRDQLPATGQGQHPFAAVLSCIDSRAPVETIFDLGLGDVFSVRIAGNITSNGILGSLEYACAVAGAKLLLVLGHTRCGAVESTLALASEGKDAAAATGCQFLPSVVTEILEAVDSASLSEYSRRERDDQIALANDVARRNALHSLQTIYRRSTAISRLADEGRIALVAGLYDVGSGRTELYLEDAIGLDMSMQKV